MTPPEVPDSCGRKACRQRLHAFAVIYRDGVVARIRPVCEHCAMAFSTERACAIKDLQRMGEARGLSEDKGRLLRTLEGAGFLTAPEGMAVWAENPGARAWD